MRALVIDTDAAIQIADRDAFEWLADRYVLLAPRLLWIETCSVLHRMMGRRRAFDGYEETMFERISSDGRRPMTPSTSPLLAMRTQASSRSTSD